MMEEENEQQLWEVWLNKETEHADSFEKYKKSLKNKQKRNRTRISQKQEAEAIEKAENILKFKPREGGS